MSSTFTVSDVVFKVICLVVQIFLVYKICWCVWIFCFHMCSFFLKWLFYIDIYRMLLCLLISMGSIWFWWLNVSVVDKFTSVTDASAVYFTFSQKTFILFLLNFFTLNHNYLTVFYFIFVLVTIIYLVWYIFICFIFLLGVSFTIFQAEVKRITLEYK